jgi:hypothetical protein
MKKSNNKNPVGRPRIEIDFDTLEKLCQLQCTRDEICGFFDVDDHTLSTKVKEKGYENFSAYYKRHLGTGKISLRRLQWKNAENGSVPMQIWLGKQMLGQTDKVETENTNIALPVIELEVLSTEKK